MCYPGGAKETGLHSMVSAKSSSLLQSFQWTKVCLSIDSKASVLRLVVDGVLLKEQGYKAIIDTPDKLNLTLNNSPGRTTNINIFSSALSTDQMKLQTSSGSQECKNAGDFLAGKSIDCLIKL